MSKIHKNSFKNISVTELQNAIEAALANAIPLDEDYCEYVADIDTINYESNDILKFSISITTDFKKGKEPF